MHRRVVVSGIAFACTALVTTVAHAQTTWLDATSGSNTISTNYTTGTGLTLNLGFFADYLVVGGGGGGGNGGGGGGGGGFLSGTAVQFNAASYGLTVGAGGNASSGGQGGTGGNSVFNSGTANGGGGGGGLGTVGTSGGSGGGGGSRSAAAGSANQPSPGFGNNGGAGSSGFNGGDLGGGGGGGAGTAGGAGFTGGAGNGGTGRASTITGVSVTYAGGGGGGRGNRAGGGAAGGTGGGGNGGFGNTNAPVVGTNELGGGGGGGGAVDGITYEGARGGSGVVVVRYAGAAIPGVGGTNTSFVGNGTIGVSGLTYQVQTFTSSGTFNLSSVDFNTRLGASLTGTISGTGGLTYNGPGRLTLAANNTYSGATTIAGGMLQIGDSGTSGSLGSGSVTNNAALVFKRSDAITFTNTITGTGAVTLQGGATLTLTGSNTYSGGTVLENGTLVLGSAGAIGSAGPISFQAGVLRYSAANTTDYSARFSTAQGQLYNIDAGGQSVTLASNLASVGGMLTSLGSGILTLTGSNDLTGGTNLFGGVVTVGSADALGPSGEIYFLNGTLRFSAANTTDYSSRFARSDTFRIDTGGQAVTFASDLSTRVLNKLGSGTLTLTGANGFSDSTTLSGGVLALGSAQALGSFGTISFEGGTLRSSALNTADYSSRFSNAAGQAYSIDTGGQSVIYASPLTSSSGSLTKLGEGTLALSGSSTYSGSTTVSAGRLAVNGALGNTAVDVLAAAELGGSGAIAGPVSVAAGGTLSPGNSIESLATGTTTFAAAATFEYEVNSTNVNSLGTAADLLVVTGDLNLDQGNGTLLAITDLASTPNPFINDTTIFALINYSGTWNGGLFTYNGNVLADGGRFFVGSQQWEIDYSRTSSAGLDNFTGDYLPSSSFVAITAVPEPSTLVLGALGIAAVAWLRRRRPKSKAA